MFVYCKLEPTKGYNMLERVTLRTW